MEEATFTGLMNLRAFFFQPRLGACRCSASCRARTGHPERGLGRPSPDPPTDMVATLDGHGAFITEDVDLFSLVLINSAIKLGGEAIAKHPNSPKLLRLIQDDLYYWP
ncbi:hypothetical protein ABZP36_017123 [Zizania latifolia]